MWLIHLINESIDQSINRLANQSINQLFEGILNVLFLEIYAFSCSDINHRNGGDIL